MGEALPVLPASSVAIALRECWPDDAVDVSHDIEYGACVIRAPSGLPSSRNWTLATPLLSDAWAASVTGPETVALSAG